MRVIVADDDRRVRLALRLFLEERGLVVVGEAASAQEIPPLVQGLRPDVLLLDWELPGLRDEGNAEVPAWAGDLRVVALSSRPVGKPDPLTSTIEFVCKTDPPDCLIAALSPLSHRQGLADEQLADLDAAIRSEPGAPDPSPRSGAEWTLPSGS